MDLCRVRSNSAKLSKTPFFARISYPDLKFVLRRAVQTSVLRQVVSSYGNCLIDLTGRYETQKSIERPAGAARRVLPAKPSVCPPRLPPHHPLRIRCIIALRDRDRENLSPDLALYYFFPFSPRSNTAHRPVVPLRKFPPNPSFFTPPPPHNHYKDRTLQK